MVIGQGERRVLPDAAIRIAKGTSLIGGSPLTGRKPAATVSQKEGAWTARR
jgi:hypothetical protein